MTQAVFKTNPNKDAIRSDFDKRLIAADAKKKGGGLTYFGLPGASMLDVLEWLPYIDRIIAVERDPDVVALMYARGLNQNLLDRLQIMEGDINDILINGTDSKGQTPHVGSFDIVNLDFYSSPLVKDLRGSAKPIEGIKALFERQSVAGHTFRLFLTGNVRVRDKGELDTMLRQIQRELKNLGRQSDETIDWYLKQRVDWKMKVWLPRTLNAIANSNQFSISDYKAVSYKGTSGSRMVHFALMFAYERDLIGLTPISPMDLLETPLFEAESGHIRPSKKRPPSVE